MKTNNIKRFVAAALCGALLLAFSGCGVDESKTAGVPQLSSQPAIRETSDVLVEESLPNETVEISSPNEKESSPDTSDENSSDDEWIKRMRVVEDKIASVTQSDEYENGSIETRCQLAMDALKELEEQGYVRKGTIYYDGESNISFIYECCEEGVLGGIMLKNFDPYMNGTDELQNSGNITETPDSGEFSDTYMDFVNLIYKMPAEEDDYKKSDFYNFLKQTDSHWSLLVTMNDGKEKNRSVLSLEKQNSNGVAYYRVYAASNDRTLYDQTLYSADGKYYSAEKNKNSCSAISEDDCKNVLNGFDLENAFGKDLQCGICNYEGKHAVYREFVSDTMMTVLFFDNSGLLGGNIYTVNGYYDEKTLLPEIGKYGDLILSGKITGSLDLPIDDSLSEIPPLKEIEPYCGTIEN